MSDERSIMLLGELKGILETFQRSTNQRLDALEESILRTRQEASDNSERNHALRDEALAKHKQAVDVDITAIRTDLSSAITMIRTVHTKVTEARGWIRALAFHGPGGLGVIGLLLHFVKGHL